jgi:hypothetical protein
MPTDAALLAEIDRDTRRRRVGVWITAVPALLLAAVVPFSLPMMHGEGLVPVEGRIVAVGKDPQSGETMMDIEVPIGGTIHRDRETAGYHYAPGEPTVGERIDYAYRVSDITGDVLLYTRADGLLRWVFGLPAAFLALVSIVLGFVLARRRRLRRHLVAHGLRLPAQGARIRHRALVLPAGGGRAQEVRMWRLEANYFEPQRAAFLPCRSEWQAAPSPASIDALPPPVVLVDPANPARCWLPVLHPA